MRRRLVQTDGFGGFLLYKKVGRLRDRPKWLFWSLSLINVIAKWPENLPKRRDLGAFHS